jgi:hypothetical protein
MSYCQANVTQLNHGAHYPIKLSVVIRLCCLLPFLGFTFRSWARAESQLGTAIALVVVCNNDNRALVGEQLGARVRGMQRRANVAIYNLSIL